MGEFGRAYESTNRCRTWKSNLVRSYAHPNYTNKGYELQVSISFDIGCAVVPDRTALLIHCSAEEAKIIRQRAILQRRTISGYVLNVMMREIAHDERLFSALGRLQPWDRIFVWNSPRPVGPRTAMLLRCLVQESARIRLAAKRRGVTISAFVIHTLRSSWNVPLQPSLSPKRPSSKQKAKV
jgi:uncharacterized protein (DUF1778 family)